MSSQDIAAVIALPSVDEPYTFGRTPHVATPFPFKPREFARLLVLRGHCQDGDPDDGAYGLMAYAHAE